MHLRDAAGMANGVDPVQGQSDLGLHCLPRPSSSKLNMTITVLFAYKLGLKIEFVLCMNPKYSILKVPTCWIGLAVTTTTIPTYAKVHNSESAIFTFSEFGAWHSLDQW